MAKRKDVELKHMKYQKYLIESSMTRLIERGNGKPIKISTKKSSTIFRTQILLRNLCRG